MANTTDDEYTVPVGKGGFPGLIARMCVCVVSGGMLFPNVFVEGMNLTKIQRRNEGTLYDKTK